MTSQEGEDSSKRAWLAVLLSLLVPGVGHVYLREWLRSAFWFLAVLLASELLIPPEALSQELTIEGFSLLWEATPTSAKLALLGLTALCMVDAYRLASRSTAAGATAEDGRTCPNCGKELDRDLDFCYWCTTELDGTAPEEAEDAEDAADDLTSR